ncbi:radical SAM protein [bacterium]|nr:radical SAM protein [bacterium]
MGNNFADSISLGLVHYPIYSLGIGRRAGIWTQGCNFRCKGCIAEYSWDMSKGKFWDLDELVFVVLKKMNKIRDGITISGGEPFIQALALKELIIRLKKNGIYDIMVYSGYSYSHLRKTFPEIMGNISALVTGRFIEGLNSQYIWKGSDNQKMHILTQNGDLKKKYMEYKKTIVKKRSLQIVKNEKKIFVVGIPDQKDTEVLKNGIC